jgi:predicted secreted hydrolase
MRVWIALGVILAFLLLWMSPWNSSPPRQEAAVGPAIERLTEIAQRFADPPGKWDYRFPEDHGSHPEQFGEYWLYTGLLDDTDGTPLGFKLAIYRLALTPEPVATESPWSTREIFWAQLVLDSGQPGKPPGEERFSRGAAGLSGAQDGRIWVDDWSVNHNPDCACFSLIASTDAFSLDLTLFPQTPEPTPFKGVPGLETAEPGAHGYWWPRQRVQGHVHDAGGSRQVTGEALLEHAWGRRLPLAQGQMTLNRFWVALADGTSIRCVQLRRRSGGGIPLGDCLWLSGDGTSLQISGRDLEPAIQRSANYPLQWNLRSSEPAASLSLRTDPKRAPLDFRLPVWSGLMQAEGTRDGQSLEGWGWLELSGY